MAGIILRRTLVYACLGGVLSAGTASAGPPVRLALTFRAGGSVPEAIREASTIEAARIWQPYGIEVDARPSAPCANAGLSLEMVSDLTSTPTGEHGGLGAIRFRDDGAPEPIVRLYYHAIVALAHGATAMGLESRWWPLSLRNEVVGRTLGRTLAHEIGHFLMRSPHHAKSGLMRARQKAQSLADRSVKAFTLTGVDLARLQIAMGAWRSAGGTPANGSAGQPQCPD